MNGNLKKQKTLCSAAWSDINIDFGQQLLKHCCRMVPEKFPKKITKDFFNNSVQIQHARNDLLNGIQTPACSSCWKSYENTGTAYRDFKNEWKKSKDLNNTITNIEITLDNICDMSCTYCEGNCSSRIAQEQKWKKILNVPENNHLEVFVEWLLDIASKQPYIALSFQGGEVTYSKNFYKFVDLLLKKEELLATEIIFSILTNCNSLEKNQKKIINLFNTLPDNWKINLAISNESVGTVTEKIRYGLDWERFQSNFREYINHKKIEQVILAPTPNVFTIKHMHEYFEWALREIRSANKKVIIIGNWINGNTTLDIATCNKDYKKYARKNIKVVKKYKNLFKDDGYSRVIQWLQTVENRIGTMSRNEDDVDTWIQNISIQKNDDSLKNLRQFL